MLNSNHPVKGTEAGFVSSVDTLKNFNATDIVPQFSMSLTTPI